MSRATPSASGPQWGWPRGIRWDRAHAAAHSPPRTEPHLICCREELVSQVPGAASEAQTGPKSPNVGTVPPQHGHPGSRRPGAHRQGSAGASVRSSRWCGGGTLLQGACRLSWPREAGGQLTSKGSGVLDTLFSLLKVKAMGPERKGFAWGPQPRTVSPQGPPPEA